MPRAVLTRGAGCPRAVWLAASALLHAVPLGLRAEAPSVKVLALTPSLLELVAEPESAAASAGPSFSEWPGAAAVAHAPARSQRQREPVARRAVAPAREDHVREVPVPGPSPEATALETAPAQHLVAAEVGAELPADADVPSAPADSSAPPAP